MPLTAFAVGSLLGVGKGVLVDKPREKADRKTAAAMTRWSPWTGVGADPIEKADVFGSALKYGTAGALLGPGIQALGNLGGPGGLLGGAGGAAPGAAQGAASKLLPGAKDVGKGVATDFGLMGDPSKSSSLGSYLGVKGHAPAFTGFGHTGPTETLDLNPFGGGPGFLKWQQIPGPGGRSPASAAELEADKNYENPLSSVWSSMRGYMGGRGR